MGRRWNNLNRAVATLGAIAVISLSAAAQEAAKIDSLFDRLKKADPADAKRISADIRMEMSKSGSAAMDLLLKRGREALEAGETEAAIEHFTALTDHAPDFAEGFHARSIAYARAELFGPAVADIERAISLRPRHFPAIYGLGAILEELGENDLAYEAYARVHSIHPHFEDVTTKLERLGNEVRGSEL